MESEHVTVRRREISTTLQTIPDSINRQCLTLRHVALTSDFLMGFSEYLDSAILSLEAENVKTTLKKESITGLDAWDAIDRFDDLDYYGSIEHRIYENKERNRLIDKLTSGETTSPNNKTSIDHSKSGNIHCVNALEFWSAPIDDYESTRQILADVLLIFPEATNQPFEKLKFAFNFLDDDALELLSDALIYLYDLKELVLTHNELTYLSFNTLSSIWNHTHCRFQCTLIHLDLSGNEYLIRSHDSGMSAFKIFVDDILMKSHLETLRLAQLSLSTVHIEELARWIVDDPARCSLRKLDLSDSTYDLMMIQSLCDRIVNVAICELETLVLRNCTFTPEAATYFGSHLGGNECLYELDVSGMDLQGFCHFCHSEGVIKCSVLRLSDLQCRSQPNWYTLKQGDISDALIKVASTKFVFVQSLYLDRGDLNNDEIEDLAAFMVNHNWIRRFVLNNNFITNDAVKSLSFCVKQTKLEAVKQCDLIMDAMVETIECALGNGIRKRSVNLYMLIRCYLSIDRAATMDNTEMLREDMILNVVSVCARYLYPKRIGEEDVMEDLSVHFSHQQFPYDLALLSLRFAYDRPTNGLSNVYLSGNSLHPTFSACFRNTSLLTVDTLRKISMRKKDKFDLVPSRSLEKFVTSMY